VVLLAVFGFRAFPEKDVTVLNDGQAYRVSAIFDPQSEGLTAAAVNLEPGDRVLSASGGRHSSVAVQRARSVSIAADGRQVSVRTQATTVGGALAEAGLELHHGDRVFVDGHATTERAPLFAAALVARPTGAVLAGATSGAADGVHVEIARSRPASVVVDTLRVETASAAADVAGLLEDLGMTVREGDLVHPGLTAPVTAGMTVRLAKARTITVRLDGKDQSLYTQAQTVGDVIRVLGLDLGPEDTVSLPRETFIQNGLTLTIGRTITAEEEVNDPVPPATAFETDPTLAVGETRIIPGAEGLRVTRYRAIYKNGELAGPRVLLSSTLAKAAVPTRHIEGTRSVSSSRPTLNAPGYTGSYAKKVTARVTWYNASQGAWARDDPNYGRTATGVIVDYGICAVDKNYIALGTRFYVPGYGPCLAADTGGAVKGWTIDLGFPESAGNSPWATQNLDIYILD
jgi:uncharacterized protein YabE (DUF348 family)